MKNELILTNMNITNLLHRIFTSGKMLNLSGEGATFHLTNKTNLTVWSRSRLFVISLQELILI